MAFVKVRKIQSTECHFIEYLVGVMGPCTFLVTGAVNGDKSISTLQRVRAVYASQGLKGFYPGGTAIAFRQATNWASRQVHVVALPDEK